MINIHELINFTTLTKAIIINSDIAHVTHILPSSFACFNIFESNEIERQYSVVLKASPSGQITGRAAPSY